MTDFPPDYDALDDDSAEVECETCGGTGWRKERKCPACGGTGLVPNEQLSDWVQDQIRAQRNKY